MRRICGMDWDCYSRATRCSWAGTPMKAVQGFGHRAAIHGPSGSTQNAKVRILVEVERRGMEQLHCGSRRSGLRGEKAERAGGPRPPHIRARYVRADAVEGTAARPDRPFNPSALGAPQQPQRRSLAAGLMAMSIAWPGCKQTCRCVAETHHP